MQDNNKINQPQPNSASEDAALSLIRNRVARALGNEPVATDQMAVTPTAEPQPAQPQPTAQPQSQPIQPTVVSPEPSKHQKFMSELSHSGKSLAEIQTEWHHYYTTLPDDEKNQVWQEFYAANRNTPYRHYFQAGQATSDAEISEGQVVATTTIETTESVGKGVVEEPVPYPEKKRPVTDFLANNAVTKPLVKKYRQKFSAKQRLKLRYNFMSIMFGLGMGALVLVVLLFGFLNEYVIAPFIQPSRKVTAAPVITTEKSAANAAPTIIIPKINVQIPIDFEVPSIDEATVQASLEGGVVHYPSTAKPGQNGNGAYFGHSSQNIFNNGKYKFAFVLLHELTTGDVFQIIYNGKVYSYQVIAREIVPPTQVSVLGDTKGKTATAALITCDPPGFNTNRLVVWGEQISPSVESNSAVETGSSADSNLNPAELASKGPTLWSRFVNAIQFWKQDQSTTP